MAEKDNTMEVAGTVKTPDVEVEKEVSIAPLGDETADTAKTDAPEEEDFSNVVSILNEIQKMNGGEGSIASLPPEIAGEIKYIVEKMVALRDVFQDPLFKPVLDDMVDQAEDGKTPSLLVAVARNVPMEQLQELADNENYADVQGAVDERLAKDKSDMEAEQTLELNFDESQASGQEYAKSMNYDEAETQDLFATAMAWFNVLADGKLTVEEWAKVDEQRNYKKDTEELRKQIPVAPEKEILPDQASIQETMTPKPVNKAVAPKNSIEAMSKMKSNVGAWEKTGKGRYGK